MKKSFVNICCLVIFLNYCLVENVYSQISAGPDKVVCEGKSVRIDGKGSSDCCSSCYSWDPIEGLSGDLKSPNPIATPKVTTTYTLKAVGPNFSFTLTDEVKVIVIDTSITPIMMSATDGSNSGSFSVNTPTDVNSVTYNWDWFAIPNSGNNPNVTFSNSASSSTIATSTHWYATPNRRRAAETVMPSPYRITCEIKADNHTCLCTNSFLLVDVPKTHGQVTQPDFVGSLTIGRRNDGEWYVEGISNFSRRPPQIKIFLPVTSQFYNKCLVHEEKHMHQWTSETPWKDLFDANRLFNNGLSHLTDSTREGLIAKINQAVSDQRQIDNQIATNTICQREIAAWRAARGTDPKYLELEDADIPGEYGCTP